MIRSKDLAAYFFANIEDIRPDRELTCEIYLVFRRNNHVMAWLAVGAAPTATFLQRYIKRGLKTIWIHSDDKALWEAYKKTSVAPRVDGKSAAEIEAEKAAAQAIAASAAEAAAIEAQINAPPAPDLAQKATEDSAIPDIAAADLLSEAKPELAPAAKVNEPKPELAPLSPAAERILAQMNTAEENAKKKGALVAREARQAIKEAMSNTDADKQAALNLEARKVAKDILDEIGSETKSMISELWAVADMDPEMTHGVNVATYGVMLSLAFGKIEKDVLVDLATAGLLHDVGVSQVPAHVAQKHWKEMSPSERQQFETHVEFGAEILGPYSTIVSTRSREIILQHHEKFNGQGYPKKLEGFRLDGTAQILAIAEMLDTLASGQFDGQVRSYQDALSELERMEKNRNFPEFFNPEIFGAVVKWVKKKDVKQVAKDALELVKSQTEEVIQASDADKAVA